MCYTFWAFECTDFMLSTEIGANGADFFSVVMLLQSVFIQKCIAETSKILLSFEVTACAGSDLPNVDIPECVRKCKCSVQEYGCFCLIY